MKLLHQIAYVLLWIGGLNWLLVGLFQFDLVAKIFGEMSTLSRVIYVLVGLAAVVTIFTHRTYCRHCAPDKVAAPMGSKPVGM